MSDITKVLQELAERVRHLESLERPAGLFVPLSAPILSVTYNGGVFSTQAKTLLDVSADMSGVPVGVKAVVLRVRCSDTGSGGVNFYGVTVGPTNGANIGMSANCGPLAAGGRANNCLIVSCDANGDIYVQLTASGANTLTVFIECWGYFAA